MFGNVSLKHLGLSQLRLLKQEAEPNSVTTAVRVDCSFSDINQQVSTDYSG